MLIWAHNGEAWSITHLLKRLGRVTRCFREIFMRVEAITRNPGDMSCSAVRWPGPLISPKHGAR